MLLLTFKICSAYAYTIFIQFLLKYECFSGKNTGLKLVLAIQTCLLMHLLFDSSILTLGHLLVQLHALTVWLVFENLKPHSLEQLLHVGWNSLWHFFPFTGANSHHSRHIVSKNLGMVHDSWISKISCRNWNAMYSVWNLCATNYNKKSIHLQCKVKLTHVIFTFSFLKLAKEHNLKIHQ